MEKILLGKPVAELLDKKSKNAINDYIAKHNKQPLLTAITVGDNPASLLYVTRKQDKALELGVNFNWLKLSESSTSNEVKEAIEDSQIKSQGIIVQLPLPEHLDFEDIVNLLSIPLIAGPGAMATSLLLSKESYISVTDAVVSYLPILVVIFIAFIAMWLSSKLASRLGPTIITVVQKIFGLLLGALAIEFVIEGIRNSFNII